MLSEVFTMIISPLFTRLLIVMIFFLYTGYSRNRKSQQSLDYFFGIGVTILVREVIITLFQILSYTKVYTMDTIIPISLTDIVIVFFFLKWVYFYSKDSLNKLFIWINAGVGLCILLSHIFSLFGASIYWFYWGWISANYIYLALEMNKISRFNTDEAEWIICSRRLIAYGTLISAIFIYLLLNSGGTRVIYSYSIALPLFYLMLTGSLLPFNQILDKKKDDELEFLYNDMESVFEYMRVLGGALADNLSLDEILNYTIASTVKTTGADAGCILMIDEYDDILKVKAVSGFFPPLYSVPAQVKIRIASLEAYFQSTPIKIGETILGESVSTGEPIFIKNTYNDPRMKFNVLKDTLFVSSLIVMPLVISRKVLGVMAVVKRNQGKFFTDSDFEHLNTFAEYSSLTIDFILTYMELMEKREMEREIGIAAKIQQQLLPKKLPRLKNASLETYSLPAKGVSGDYYDAIQLKGGKTALVMCDVAGKGVPAALVMVMIRSILHLIASSDREVSTLLTWVNRGVSGQIDIDHYATMCMLFFNQNTNEVTYTNAAHHPLLIYRHKTKSTETIDTEGLPVGIDKDTKYGQKRTKLYTGDVIVLYTDGIIEAMNLRGEQYTSERFTKLIMEVAHLTSKEIVKAIKDDLAMFVGAAKQHDDQTLLVMKMK